METGIVDIHGKDYQTVALRVQKFRTDHPEYGILTDVIGQAELVTVKATITDNNDRVLANGHAEEDRSKGNINRTSALENCETSAVGRALAFLGYGGTEIASLEEMEKVTAINNDILQRIADAKTKEAVKKVYDSIEGDKDKFNEIVTERLAEIKAK